MSSHFQWYPSDASVVVPWNARYAYPNQSNKAVKTTPRIPPQSGGVFVPGNTIRLNFPAQGYLNCSNTTLTFDATMYGYGAHETSLVRFQNNIQSLFTRVRILYGSTTLEDVVDYAGIMRCLTEWTCTNQSTSMDGQSISDGIGGVVPACGPGGTAAGPVTSGLINTRSAIIQGLDGTVATTGSATAQSGMGNVPNTSFGSGPTSSVTRYSTRRYQVNLGLGLLTQDKLIPLKYMASQLSIEITLAQPSGCMFAYPTTAANSSTQPTYAITNVNLIPELVEFDSSYDTEFVQGLEARGVPIKFSSWHTYSFATGGSSTVNCQIQERSRSVKAIFAVLKRNPENILTDSGATFFDTAAANSTGSTMQSYQFRIGGRYFPAQPVQLNLPGLSISNGGAEAFVELQKSLNILGDYRLSSSVNALRWANQPATSAVATVGISSQLNEFDYLNDIVSYSAGGNPTYRARRINNATTGMSLEGSLASACFCSSIDLETSNGIEISGLNAEEQSDISFNAAWSHPQDVTFGINVYTYYDAMIILKLNNVIDLVQ